MDKQINYIVSYWSNGDPEYDSKPGWCVIKSFETIKSSESFFAIAKKSKAYTDMPLRLERMITHFEILKERNEAETEISSLMEELDTPKWDQAFQYLADSDAGDK